VGVKTAAEPLELGLPVAALLGALVTVVPLQAARPIEVRAANAAIVVLRFIDTSRFLQECMWRAGSPLRA
jgi:hypothetical protein